MVNPPPNESGRGCAVSELDFLKRRGVTYKVVDVLLFNVAGDGIQDLENVGAVVTLAQKRKSQFAGHDFKKGLGFGGVFLGRCLSHCSVQAHTGEEGNLCSVRHTEEPLEVLLEYRFASDSVRLKKCIQTRLGGVGLKPTIKKAHPSVTDLSDAIPMKEYKTHTILVNHHGVVALPISLSDDRLIHQAFDLAHGVGRLN